jgi:hypothetical protein
MMARPATALKTRHLHTAENCGRIINDNRAAARSSSSSSSSSASSTYVRQDETTPGILERILNTNTKVVIVVINTNTNPAARCQSFILLRMSAEKSITYERESSTYEYESTNTVRIRDDFIYCTMTVRHTNIRVQ